MTTSFEKQAKRYIEKELKEGTANAYWTDQGHYDGYSNKNLTHAQHQSNINMTLNEKVQRELNILLSRRNHLAEQLKSHCPQDTDLKIHKEIAEAFLLSNYKISQKSFFDLLKEVLPNFAVNYDTSMAEDTASALQEYCIAANNLYAPLSEDKKEKTEQTTRTVSQASRRTSRATNNPATTGSGSSSQPRKPSAPADPSRSNSNTQPNTQKSSSTSETIMAALKKPDFRSEKSAFRRVKPTTSSTQTISPTQTTSSPQQENHQTREAVPKASTTARAEDETISQNPAQQSNSSAFKRP